jgi:hypothetical protein
LAPAARSGLERASRRSSADGEEGFSPHGAWAVTITIAPRASPVTLLLDLHIGHLYSQEMKAELAHRSDAVRYHDSAMDTSESTFSARA